MSTYTLHVGGWTEDVDKMIEMASHVEGILDRLFDEVVSPILLKHYLVSGIKSHSYTLKQAIIKRGAPGNFVTHHGFGMTVGVDYAQVPYAKWVLEGRGPVRAKNKKALAFRIDGKLVIVKSVKAAPAHDVYYLTSEEQSRCEKRINEMLMEAMGK